MKTYVRTDWVAKNEYTKPILDIPIYRNSGIIKAVTKENEKIQAGKITYKQFENEEFQYIISPFWPIFEHLYIRWMNGREENSSKKEFNGQMREVLTKAENEKKLMDSFLKSRLSVSEKMRFHWKKHCR